jgi:hypothetical protein
MKKKMFALAFGLLLAFGVQGQFAVIDPIQEIAPGEVGTQRKCVPIYDVADPSRAIVECFGVGDACFRVTQCFR